MTRVIERIRRQLRSAEVPETPRKSRFVRPHVDHLSQGYVPSFFEGRPYINDFHPEVEARVDHIRGKLAPADHLKLYEAGYFARGPVLEIGRLHGRSTVILALGLCDGRRRVPMFSIEYEDRYLRAANRHLRQFGVRRRVHLLQGDSSTVVRGLPGSFDTVFVDGDHSYDGVLADLAALQGRVDPFAVLMFHDYFHPLNETGEYGVRRAVDEHREELGLAFRGRFGGIALFEKTG